jgi:NAD(P)H-dependent flavin oxidoreductase YrpB (nitropropane dioxygenase family)
VTFWCGGVQKWIGGAPSQHVTAVPERRAGAVTSFTELVGCPYPLQLAAMGGGVGGPELAAAVRDAGGLGMVTAGEAVPSGCGVGFLAPFIDSLNEVAEATRQSHIIEFFYGAPNPALVACAHDGGALVGWQVGSASEAAAAQAAGCDYVIAQGFEAGGHVRGDQPLDVVLAEVRVRVAVPVVAAGGISSPDRVAELIAAGADAVRVGTAFLACPEARTHPDYVASILNAAGDATVLTEWFNEGWPGAPHRVLRAALEAAKRSGWRAVKPPTRDDTRSVSDMAQYAGTGVGGITISQSAHRVLRHLVSRVV